MSDTLFDPLETSRLLLRCLADSDAQATASLMTPEVARWLASWPWPLTPEMAAARIEKARARAAAHNIMPFAVIEKATGDFMGWATVNRDPEKPRRAWFGYWLGEPYHGKGYMREAAPVVLRAAFSWLDIDWIDAAAQVTNTASIAVMRNCGMGYTGEGMYYAPARDVEELCAFYALARADCLREI